MNEEALRMVCFRLEKKLHHQVKLFAFANNSSMQQIIAEALKKYFEENKLV